MQEAGALHNVATIFSVSGSSSISNDTTFDTDGHLRPGDVAYGLTLQYLYDSSLGKYAERVVISGTDATGSSSQFALATLEADGTLPAAQVCKTDAALKGPNYLNADKKLPLYWALID